MELIQTYWHQLIFIGGLIVVAVKLSAAVKELRKDVDDLTRRDTYVEVVKLRAQIDMHEKNISALWVFSNQMRARFNGTRKSD